ncbi:DUF1853 family protein [Dokdonia sinensis]|uniref:DUF1853 family protein n=1 Tax=Dokdonia sinensis TaxID=2479847 RepID=A0A3M0FXA3_9FLAO|nr:DUF1853 family protein [Dokdonia sinensis]RMB57331.1 DUF1853 family protein [Dokdonia sinensis]
MKHILGFLDTQPLWKKEQFGLKQFEMPEIDLETFTPAPIPTKLRLGHQVEYIFKQLLEHSSHYEILAHNIQIKRGSETIGELDFIVNDLRFRESGTSLPSNKKLLHIELTYKFYIIDPSISEPIHRLMGPNRKDMFFTKMEKTRDKQLPLLFSKESQQVLAHLEIDVNEIEQQTYYIGQLFVPYNENIPSIRPLNMDCVTGFWVKMKEFEDVCHFGSAQHRFRESIFYIPHKYEWLHQPHNEVAWQSHLDILMEINIKHINNYAPMIWMKNRDGTITKGFVVWW